MKNTDIAKVYSKALSELGKEVNQDVYLEIAALIKLLNENEKLELVLFLNVFSAGEKEAVLKDVLAACGFSDLFKNFLNYLLKENRLSILPQIYKEMITLEDSERGFIKVSVEGRETSLNTEAKQLIEKMLTDKLKQELEITYKQVSNITSGFKISAGEFMVDASIESQLNAFKKSITN